MIARRVQIRYIWKINHNISAENEYKTTAHDHNSRHIMLLKIIQRNGPRSQWPPDIDDDDRYNISIGRVPAFSLLKPASVRWTYDSFTHNSQLIQRSLSTATLHHGQILSQTYRQVNSKQLPRKWKPILQLTLFCPIWYTTKLQINAFQYCLS